MAESTGTVTVQVEATLVSASIDTRAFWLDVLDRTSKSFVQNLLIFFTAGATIISVAWPQALSSAALAAVVSLVLAVATATAITSGNFMIDLFDRAVRTGAGALAGAIPLTGGIADIAWGQALSIAGTAVVVSIGTSVLSINVGSAKGVPSWAPVLGNGSQILTEDDSEDEPKFDRGGGAGSGKIIVNETGEPMKVLTPADLAVQVAEQHRNSVYFRAESTEEERRAADHALNLARRRAGVVLGLRDADTEGA